ncbi:Alpha/beta hydrolase fold-1 [Penicillium angulare]|uniref:Alpha/beta hydrolase fold-1 n=1 Tax=Penicillium angulare TaxID=116970 RepID=UPI0025407A96|nr:Alpha/beta hydrolase fold-1 [Penicillium angulare]KAJ5256980.1 Alpha/beta hydrolase fold-1 [Penicillium angulare]
MAPKSSNYASIIIPGSFTLPGSYTKLIAALQSTTNAPATAISLPSVNDGTKLPPATLEDDAALVRASILEALDSPTDPRDVVLICHSYGGLPGTCAVEGLTRSVRAAQGKPTAVVGIVYMAAFILPNGTCMRDTMGPIAPEEYRIGVRGGYLPAPPAELMVACFNDVPRDEALESLKQTALHSSDSYDGKVWFEGWREVPSLQILPGGDVIISREKHEEMFLKTKAAGANIVQKVFDGASHGLMLSVPDKIAAAIGQFVDGEL